MENSSDPRWACVVDHRRGRLVQCEKSPGGSWRVDADRSITNEWEDLHEHGRPSGLSAGAARGHAQSHAAPARETEEERRRFAKDVIEWLEKEVRSRKIERLPVFAPPKLLGALRSQWPKALAPHVREHEADLAHLDDNRLTENQRFIDALAEAR